MKFVLRSTDLKSGTTGYTAVPASKLLIIYFSSPDDRTRDPVSGHSYPHISLYCTTLSQADKAYGTEITALVDSFHISFDSARKVWRLITATADVANPVLITVDNSKDSATLGVTAKVGKETWTADDICTKFLLPILKLRATA